MRVGVLGPLEVVGDAAVAPSRPKERAVVAFLASDDGHWVTGQTIEASGGYRL